MPLLLAAPAFPQELIGFHPDRVEAQREMEQRADEWIVADDLLEWNRIMTPRPHHAGSPQAEANARWMVERFREWGFEAEIETFDVLFPTPRLRSLTLLEPTRFDASLIEEPAAGDGAAEVAVSEGLPPFNAFSADGDVTAELVYVNRGIPADYEVLERLGIDVAGKIVIARYGGSWRGIKPKVAFEHGAVGCLIFNDPGDDGYSQGAAYPEGSFKHASAVQRGSVLDLPVRPGDPLAPMRGAVDGAERLDRSEAETLMRIPVLPIAWRDAQPLLEALGGEVAPEDWRGGLPITYRIGPGPARVRLQLEFDWDLVPAHNVIARLTGAERPDQWILRGNHHDAWVIGGRDPISGLVALMAEARAVGRLAREGHPPRRTIVYAAWDAEEPGLRLVLRLANADVLPFEFGATAATVGRYVDEVVELAANERSRLEREGELARSGAFRLAADPTRPFVEPDAQEPAPYLNFAPLRNAHDRLTRAARAADQSLVAAVGGGDEAVQVQLDELIVGSERLLTRDHGLPGRPWFRHHLYSPGLYTGYGVKTLPGVREAIEQGDWEEAQTQIDIAAQVLDEYAEQLKRMARATVSREP